MLGTSGAESFSPPEETRGQATAQSLDTHFSKAQPYLEATERGSSRLKREALKKLLSQGVFHLEAVKELSGVCESPQV